MVKSEVLKCKSMTDKELQNILNEKINSYESGLDLDKHWESLSSELKRNKKEHKLFYLIALLAFLLAGMSVYVFSDIHSSSDTKSKNDDFVNVNKSRVSNNDSQSKDWDKKGSNNDNIAYQNNAINPNSKDTKPDGIKQIDIKRDEIAFVGNRCTSATVESRINDSTNSINQVDSDSQSDNSEIKYVINDNKDLVYDNSKSVKAGNGNIMNIELLNKLHFELSKNSLHYEITSPDFIHFNKLRNMSNLSIVFGTAVMISPLIHKAKTSEAISLKNFRSVNEKPLETYQMQLGMKLALRKYYLSAGILYSQGFSRLDYTQELKKEYLVKNALLEERYYTLTNTNEKLYGDTSVTGKQIVEGIYFTKYKSVDLYIGIGKKLWSNGLYYFNIDAGILANISNTVKGKTIDQYDFNITDASSIYKSNVGLGFISNLSIGYHLDDRIDISLGARGVYYFNNINVSGYRLKTHLFRYGLGGNIVYRF